MLVRGLPVMLLVVKLSRGLAPSEGKKEGRGLWEQFPGPTIMPQSIRTRAGPSVEVVMPRGRSVTGDFWGQIVEKNKGVGEMAEGRSSPRSTRLASSQGETRRSQVQKKVGTGRRRKQPEFNIPDFGIDRMGSLGEDYYEYLDDYGDDLGNVDMVEEEEFMDKPMDAMEAHRWMSHSDFTKPSNIIKGHLLLLLNLKMPMLVE